MRGQGQVQNSGHPLHTMASLLSARGQPRYVVMHGPWMVSNQQEDEPGIVQAREVFRWALRETMDAGLDPSS